MTTLTTPSASGTMATTRIRTWMGTQLVPSSSVERKFIDTATPCEFKPIFASRPA